MVSEDGCGFVCVGRRAESLTLTFNRLCLRDREEHSYFLANESLFGNGNCSVVPVSLADNRSVGIIVFDGNLEVAAER